MAPAPRKRALSMYVGRAEKSLVEKSLLAESTSEMDVIESNDEGSEWKRSQVAELVEIVKKLLPKDDTLSYTRRMKGIKWDRIKVADKTGAQCKAHLEYMFKKLRHMRSVAELMADPCFNPTLSIKKRSPSAFNVFCNELRKEPDMPRGKEFLKKAAERYRALMPDERIELLESAKTEKKVIKAKHSRESLLLDLEAQPITPFIQFCKAEVQKGNLNKRTLKSLYKSLPVDEKSHYVIQAVNEVNNQSSNLIGLLSFLSKDELKILQGTGGKTPNAYNLFVKEFCQGGGNLFKEAPIAYRNLTPAEKLKYQNMAEALKDAEAKKLEDTKNNSTMFQIKSEKSDVATPDAKSKKRKIQKSADTDDPPFKSPTKPAPHATETSVKSNGTPSKKRKVSESNAAAIVDKAKSIKVEKERPVEPERVPTTLFGYFEKFVYAGKAKKAKKAFEKIDRDQRKVMKADYKKTMNQYMTQLEAYLATLSKEEMTEYADRSRRMAEEEPFDSFLSSASEA